MNKRIAGFFLLCTLGVMGLSSSALAMGGSGKLSAKNEERIRKEERRRAAGFMGPDAARLQHSEEMTQTGRGQVKCPGCEQFKTSFNRSRQWPCNQTHFQHLLCDDCNITGICDVCAHAPRQQPQSLYPSLDEPDPSSLRMEELSVSDPLPVAQRCKPPAAAVGGCNLGPVTATEVVADDVYTVFFQWPNTKQSTVKVSAKDTETWTVRQLKGLLYDQLKYEGDLVLCGKTLADDELLNKIKWADNLIIHARVRVSGGE